MPGFTSQYFLERLVYFEDTDDVGAAIAREKEFKGWRCSKKIALVQKVNPQWPGWELSRDLIEYKYGGEPAQIAARRSLTRTLQLHPAPFGMTDKGRASRVKVETPVTGWKPLRRWSRQRSHIQ
jgi:hypothetical protein